MPLKHRIPCFGYVIQESDKPGKLDVEKAKKLGVKPGPDLGLLKSGKSVIAVGTGQEIKVTIMCRNDVLSWFFTNRLSATR